MSISHPNYPPNGQDLTFLIRLERAVTRLGMPYGYDGDPLAERFPEADTEADLWAACDLLQLLPVELRNWDRQLAYRMCQAAVFGRTQAIANPSANVGVPTVAEAKLARERNRRKSRRASA